MLSINNIGIFYQQWILQNLSFSVNKGEIVAILGTNGRGKSSLLLAIAGITDMKQGKIMCHAKMGYVPQFINLNFAMSALDLVLTGRVSQIGWFGSPSKKDKQIALDALAKVGVEHFAHRNIQLLSGGERQLVLIARAICSQTPIILLDEPASALDLHHQGTVLRLLRSLAKQENITILFTTHDPRHALEIADNALLLHNVSDFDYGPIKETITAEKLTRLYHLPIRRTQLYDDSHPVEIAVPLYHIQH